MKPKQQRLVLALAALAAVTGSSLLAMSALDDKADYFYSPGDVERRGVEQGRAMRLGGMVERGSLRHAADGVTLAFVVHDETNRVPVTFKGIAPDLFREGSGVVAEGSFRGSTFVATNLLAKHDERYMTPEQAGAEHKTSTLAQ